MSYPFIKNVICITKQRNFILTLIALSHFYYFLISIIVQYVNFLKDINFISVLMEEKC